MPTVAGKKFAYTPKGMAKAKKAVASKKEAKEEKAEVKGKKGENFMAVKEKAMKKMMKK